MASSRQSALVPRKRSGVSRRHALFSRARPNRPRPVRRGSVSRPAPASASRTLRAERRQIEKCPMASAHASPIHRRPSMQPARPRVPVSSRKRGLFRPVPTSRRRTRPARRGWSHGRNGRRDRSIRPLRKRHAPIDFPGTRRRARFVTETASNASTYVNRSALRDPRHRSGLVSAERVIMLGRLVRPNGGGTLGRSRDGAESLVALVCDAQREWRRTGERPGNTRKGKRAKHEEAGCASESARAMTEVDREFLPALYMQERCARRADSSRGASAESPCSFLGRRHARLFLASRVDSPLGE